MGESIAEVAAIAAKLTPAQRNVILTTSRRMRLGGKGEGAPFAALLRAGLVTEGRDPFNERTYCLSERGVAVRNEVRNYLISQGADQ